MKIKILSVLFLLLLGGVSSAQNNLARVHFQDEARYDIYYQVSEDQIHSVQAVQILGTTTINDRLFLEYTKNTLSKPKDIKGYIIFDSVRAIHPNGVRVNLIENEE